MRVNTVLRRWGKAYTARDSKAVRSLMTNIGPSSRIKRFLLNRLISRVTVSREAPILIAISSCVIGVGLQPASRSSSSRTWDSKSLANLPADERVSTRS